MKLPHYSNSIRVSNSLDPDQDQQFVSPDLGPDCYQYTKNFAASKVRIKYYSVAIGDSSHFILQY